MNQARKNICFINNFNNEKFIEACLGSVLQQSTPFDQVLVIDDGSTDRSLEIIQHHSQHHSHLHLISKKNEGQFSTFNTAAAALPDNAQIFLLDGDDIYPHDYLEASLSAIGVDQWDFAFCEQQKFTESSDIPDSAILNHESAYFFTSTSGLVRSRECWIGNPTSCISLSSELFKRLFPYSYDRQEKFWVDDFLIYASSILGAKKIYLPSIAVGWRMHADNNSKKHYSHSDIKIREIAIARVFNDLVEKHKIPRYPSVSEFFHEYDALGKYWQKRLDLPSQYKMFNRLLRQQIKNIVA